MASLNGKAVFTSIQDQFTVPLYLQISLHVLYAPQVRAVRRLVEGGAGMRAVLECVVAARPRPEVRGDGGHDKHDDMMT